MKNDGHLKYRGMGHEVPPLFKFVEIYFLQKDRTTEDALAFFRFYELRDWKGPSGITSRNWKTLACDWIWAMRFGNRTIGYR